MTKARLFAVTALLLSATLGASAQGVSQQNGVRSGYGSTSSGGMTTSPTSPAPAASSASQPRNLGTGQGRSEGALGMSQQLQRELGISKQQ